jgi:Zn-dependent peptidase ImmA (M78 family)
VEKMANEKVAFGMTGRDLTETSENFKNIREFIPDFYSYFPDIKTQIDRLLMQDNNAINYAKDPSVDIKAIAKKIGIYTIFNAPPQVIQNQHSLLLGGDTILLNEDDNQEEKRFSIAHEVAFVVLKGKNYKIKPDVARSVEKQWESLSRQFVSKGDDISRRTELAFYEKMEIAFENEMADYFAANLLVPTERFVLFGKKSDKEIARLFKVSVACIKKRRPEIENEINLLKSPSELECTVNEMIKISRGKVVGIGKVKIPKTQEFTHEIQLLSFLDIQESETSFISTCIQLRIDGYGKTIEEAEEDMDESIYYFLCENFNKLSAEDAWKNIKDLYKSDEWSNELWDAYHEVQIQLSINGIAIDNTAGLLMRLEYLEERIKEWETRVENEELEKARVRLADTIRTLARDLIVDKIHFGVAA